MKSVRVKVTKLTKEERNEVFKEHMDSSRFVGFSKSSVDGNLYYVFCYEQFIK